MTDENSSYIIVGREFADHGVVRHVQGEYVSKGDASVHTNTPLCRKGRFKMPADKIQQRRFSRAAGPHKRRDLPARDRQAEALHKHPPADGEADILKRQAGVHARLPDARRAGKASAGIASAAR